MTQVYIQFLNLQIFMILLYHCLRNIEYPGGGGGVKALDLKDWYKIAKIIKVGGGGESKGNLLYGEKG